MARVQASKSSSGAVSIWRTYFVANEWNEIQTCRKTNLTFNLITCVFFLSVIGIGNWATTDPYKNYQFDDANQYNAPMSCVLRFALIASVYLLTGETLLDWFSPEFVESVYLLTGETSLDWFSPEFVE